MMPWRPRVRVVAERVHEGRPELVLREGGRASLLQELRGEVTEVVEGREVARGGER